MKFIDLFAGIGGFHIALKKLGHECVFACEIDNVLANLYEKNFGIKPAGDIKKISIESIPEHDILCGGFPCQPYSKAGKMQGIDHYYGDLFSEIIKILEIKKPKYIFLENVAYLKNQGNGIVWQNIQIALKNLGYDISHAIFSPHQFGIPQHRQRIYIVGALQGLEYFKWLEPKKDIQTDIQTILEKNPKNAKKIGLEEKQCLSLWQEFIDCIPKNTPIPKFPIWGMEFGATYPIENGVNPNHLSSDELSEYNGVFGKSLKGLTKEEQFKNLPSYVFNTDSVKNFPEWKKRYIKLNREFYETHKNVLEDVVSKIAQIPIPSWQKLEWNVGNSERKIENYIIQFRASGIRLKKTDTSPSLVCTNTQIPIIGWEGRYITKEEGAKLQSIENIELPESFGTCFKALGNAVNVEIVYQIANQLLI